MSVSYSANAVYAKAHALYGKRLKKQNYIDLVSCHNTQELIDYLKTRTQYGDIFVNLPSDMDVTQIEELLKLQILTNIESLCKYEISAGERIYRYFIIKNDIKQLLSFIHHLISGNPEKYLNSLPPFFNKHTELNLYTMAESRSFAELLKAIEGTPYHSILIKYKDTFDNRGTYLQIESSLNKYCADYIYSIIDKATTKGKKELKELLSYRFDMDKIIRIYRINKMRIENNVKILDYFDCKYTNFSKKDVQLFINQKAGNIFDIISKTFYKKDFSGIEYPFPEYACQMILFRKFDNTMRYSTNPTAVMLSYVYLIENEIQNIIRIVEGIKYNVSDKNISASLVGADKE